MDPRQQELFDAASEVQTAIDTLHTARQAELEKAKQLIEHTFPDNKTQVAISAHGVIRITVFRNRNLSEDAGS